MRLFIATPDPCVAFPVPAHGNLEVLVAQLALLPGVPGPPVVEGLEALFARLDEPAQDVPVTPVRTSVLHEVVEHPVGLKAPGLRMPEDLGPQGEDLRVVPTHVRVFPS